MVALRKTQKDEMLQIQTGEIRFMLANKAFGMGLIYLDINVVYHCYDRQCSRLFTRNWPGGFRSCKSRGRAKLDYMPRILNEIRSFME